MVCNRCILVVKSELEKFGLHPFSVELGEAKIDREISSEEKKLLNQRFEQLGFEIIEDKKSRLIENIKKEILIAIHSPDEPISSKFSEYISRKLHQDYSYLSNLFSEVEGITIEKYFIAQKIERVKELLVYDEFSLSQIADQLHYSSVSHLSRQFKKVTGLTPTHFKQIKESKRKSIDRV